MPSPIANSQITLATPIKMPNTVNSDRSGCKARFLTPSFQACSQKTFMNPTPAADRIPLGRRRP